MKSRYKRIASFLTAICLTGSVLTSGMSGILPVTETMLTYADDEPLKHGSPEDPFLWTKDSEVETGTHVIVTYFYDGGKDIQHKDLGYLSHGEEPIRLDGSTLESPKEGEEFSGFSVGSGQSAIEFSPDGKNATISYHEDCHVAKLNVFFQSKGNIKDGSGESGDFSPEKDVTSDGILNTSEGLHTNKTAYVSELDTEENGRIFDLKLQSWYNSTKPPEVGLVLDASGSMAFTADELIPMRVGDVIPGDGEDSANYVEFGGTTFDTMTYLPLEMVNKLMNPNYTENSKLSYAAYTYYVFDERAAVNEFAPLAYWDGVTLENTEDHAENLKLDDA